MKFDSTTSYTLYSKFARTLDEDLNSRGSVKTNSEASILTTSHAPRQLTSLVELWGPEEQNEYRSITHGVGIILKEKRPSVRGKDHFVDDTLGKCCVKINDLKDGERHEMCLLLELIVSTLITTQSEKESTLAYYHRIHDNNWAEIAKHLPGRLVLLIELSDGFILEKISSPLGVLVIFKSRPEALVQV
ncbi:C2 domain-containing protein-like protein [Tanacetum coccineum]